MLYKILAFQETHGLRRLGGARHAEEDHVAKRLTVAPAKMVASHP